MRTFRNLKVGQKLSLLIIISLLGFMMLGVLSLYQQSESQNKLENMYSQKLLPTFTLITIKANEQKVKSKLIELMITTDVSGNQTLKNEIGEITNETTAIRQGYQTDNAEELTKMAALDEVTKEYLRNREQLIQLAVENKNNEAYYYYEEGVLPSLSKMEVIIDDLVALHVTDAKMVYENNKVENQQMRSIAKIVIVGGLLLFLVLGYFITRSVTRPVQEVKHLMAQASEGLLTVTGTYTSKDELGVLTASFNQMMKALRELIGTVRDTSREVAASSSELSLSSEQSSQASEYIAQTTQELSVGAENQAQSTQRSSAIMNEMAQKAQYIANAAKTVSGTSEAASVRSEEGATAISNAIQQMNAINTRVTSLSQAVTELGERSMQVEIISKSITDISSQTNLLALNAAIEASRAGEHGRGFAVVADEVRQLAEESSLSAKQISELIRLIQSETQTVVQSMAMTIQEVNNGIDVVNGAGTAFGEIHDAIRVVSNQIDEVACAVEQLSTGAESVAEAIQKVSQVSGHTANGTQQVSAATEEQLASMVEINTSASKLSNIAVELNEVIAKFKIDEK
ncbi:HAMP domain-containing methyl-accepting chemotaxis protein [Paenibacillus jamilae]|nr:HAMP domain-containing methyl-accepting chemotaxis protein [Paenibacillus jamilae]